MQYPYSDEYMVFDDKKRRYILTAKCIMDHNGIDLQTRLNVRGNANPQAAINGFLDRVSALTYRYLYQFNDNNTIDRVVSECPSARETIREAMESQTLYMLVRGDLSMSQDEKQRLMWFDETAKTVLSRTIPETGVSLTYQGAYRRW